MGLRFPSMAVAVAVLLGASPLCHAQLESVDCCCTAHASPSCSDSNCSAIVCQLDPYCCYYAWDATCASLAATNCGAAAPYCLDLNQDGTADICATPSGPDCDGDGLPDTDRNGPQGGSTWVGATTGVRSFETETNWSYGRPGKLTSAYVALPYAQGPESLVLHMDCDNAIESMSVINQWSDQLRDFQLDLGGRTLRMAGSGFDFASYAPSMLSATIGSGIFLAQDAPLFLSDQGLWEVRFSQVQLLGGTFGWSTPTYGGSPHLVLDDSAFSISSFGWPGVVDGVAPESHLKLRNSTLQLTSSPTGGGSLFSIPASGTLVAETTGVNGISKIQGSGVSVFMDTDSTLELNGHLQITGTLTVGGRLVGRSNCPGWRDGCQASRLDVTSFTYPVTDSDALITWTADLSGELGTTPDEDASIRVSGGAWIDGLLRVTDSSSNGVPAVGLSVPLLRATAFTSGHDNFDAVRAYNNDGQPLGGGFYITTDNVGGVVRFTVKRGASVATTPSLQSTLTDSPLRTVVLNDGASSGTAEVVTIAATTQGSIIRRYLVNLAQGAMAPSGLAYGLADPTDMAAGDLDGDGQKEIVVSYGAPGKTVAYRWTGNGFATLWTRSFGSGTRAECVCVLPPPSARSPSLLPAGSGTATGTSAGSKGGVTTTDSGGSITGTAEVASVPRTVNGTDIDNDEAVATGGTDESAAFMPGQPSGFIQIVKRSPTGGLTALTPVQVPGVPNALVVADLDGDGYKDVAASCDGLTSSYPTGSRPVAVVLRGTSANTSASRLRAPIAVEVGDGPAQGTSISLTDADGDGYPDLAIGWGVSSGQGYAFGGASVVQIRDRRTSGGLSLGGTTDFASSTVTGLTPVGGSSLLSLEPPAYGGGSPALRKTDFTGVPVPGDLDGDGQVGPADLAILLLDFGPCPDPATAACPSDLDGSGTVDTGDISFLLMLFD